MAVSRLSTVQMLRAVAALSVVAFHLAGEIGVAMKLEAGNVFPIGSAGVDIFFVISGFIICYTTRNNFNIGDFIIKRLARIVPLYWFLTLSVFAIALVAPKLLGSTVAEFGTLIKSLFFIPYEKSPGVVQPVLFLGWTLNFEMFFYALFAIALIFGRHRVLVIGALLIAVVIFGHFYEGDSVVLQFYSRGIVLEFLWGCIIYELFEKAPHILARARPLWIVAVAAFAALNFYEPDGPREIVRGLPAALLTASLLTMTPPAGWASRFMERLGDASYSIYLIHPYIVSTFVRIVLKKVGFSAVTIAGAAAAAIVVTIIVSLALYRYLEKPSNAALRRRMGV